VIGSPTTDTVHKLMIEARQISKSFGRVRALAGVSFRVEPGQVVGLLGRNGAGKSTAMRIVTGYLHPDAGRANVCGLDTVGRPVAARARVGYLPESGSAHPEMSVRDYLRYRARLHGLAGRRLRAALDRVFDRFASRPVEPVTPRLLIRDGSVRPVLPGDSGWDEAGA